MFSVTPYLLLLLFITAAGAASGSVQVLYIHVIAATGSEALGVFLGTAAILTSSALLTLTLWRRRQALSRSIVAGSALQIATQEMVRSIAQCLSIPEPQVVLVSSSTAREARVDFLRRRPIVVIPRAIAALGIHRPRHLEGLLAHELSHLANGDARRAGIARIATGLVARVIACCAILVALMLFISYGQGIVKFGWRYSIEVALAAFVSGTLQYAGYATFLVCGYALLLQVREFYADAGARRLGYANELQEMLKGSSIPWHRAWRHITAFHPPASHRIESLRDPSGIHELRFTPIAVASALAYASTNLLAGVAYSLDDRHQLVLYGLIVLLLSLPFVVIAYQYGTKFSASSSTRRGHLAKGMVVGASAVVTGVMVSGVLVQLIERIEAEAPYGQIALDQLWNQLTISFFPAGVLVGTMLVGTAMSASPAASRIESGLWLLFAFAFAFMLGQASLLASFLLIWGDEVNEFLAFVQAMILQIDTSKSVNARDFNALLGIWIGIPVAAAVTGVGAVLLVSMRRARSLMPGSVRALAAICLLIAGMVGGGVTGYAAGVELYMRNTIWVSCQSIVGAESAEGNALTQARKLLIEELIAAGDQAQTFRGQLFFGHMEEGECGATPTEDRRPWYRTWLMRFGLAKDGIVALSVEPKSSKIPPRVLASYFDGDTRSDLGRISVHEDAVAVAARAFQKYDPYRYALLLRGKGVDDSEAMKQAAHSSDNQTRAWALTQVARTDLASGNRNEAERKFLLALELSPGHPIAGGILTDLYFDSGRCAEAVNLVESIRRTSEFTAWRLQRAASCQGQGALAYLYKYRNAFSENAIVLAQIGEHAYHQRRFSLADLYFERSLAVTNKQAALAKVGHTRVGCVDLYVAIRKNSDVCVGDSPCMPPIDLQTGREHMCWANYTASYKKSAEARKHFEIAVKMDPRLADSIAIAVAKLP